MVFSNTSVQCLVFYKIIYFIFLLQFKKSNKVQERKITFEVALSEGLLFPILLLQVVIYSVFFCVHCSQNRLHCILVVAELLLTRS